MSSSANPLIGFSRKRLMSALSAIGGDLELDESDALTADAPPGYCWAANGGTVIVEPAANLAGDRFMRDALDRLIDLIGHGLRRCTPEESAEFEHMRDEPWSAQPDAPEVIAAAAIATAAA